MTLTRVRVSSSTWYEVTISLNVSAPPQSEWDRMDGPFQPSCVDFPHRIAITNRSRLRPPTQSCTTDTGVRDECAEANHGGSLVVPHGEVKFQRQPVRIKHFGHAKIMYLSPRQTLHGERTNRQGKMSRHRRPPSQQMFFDRSKIFDGLHKRAPDSRP